MDTETPSTRDATLLALHTQLGQGQNVIPLSPSSRKVLDVCACSSSTLSELESAVAADPERARRVIKQANGPSYSAGRNVLKLGHALTLLGQGAIGNMTLRHGLGDALQHLGPSVRNPLPAEPAGYGGTAATSAFNYNLGRAFLALLLPDKWVELQALVDEGQPEESACQDLLGVSIQDVASFVLDAWNTPEFFAVTSEPPQALPSPGRETAPAHSVRGRAVQEMAYHPRPAGWQPQDAHEWRWDGRHPPSPCSRLEGCATVQETLEYVSTALHYDLGLTETCVFARQQDSREMPLVYALGGRAQFLGREEITHLRERQGSLFDVLLEHGRAALVSEVDSPHLRWRYPGWFRAQFRGVHTFVVVPLLGGWERVGFVLGHWGTQKVHALHRDQRWEIVDLRQRAGMHLGNLLCMELAGVPAPTARPNQLPSVPDFELLG